ncbi:MAG: DinB family protein [Gemmatimonadetes bacterium]|nr:DinB family protein [Gemmatimonadota bacterium]
MSHFPGRPAPDEYADFYGTYIAAVKEPLLDTLEAEADAWRALLADVPPDREGHRYAPGKWSVREVVGHVIDAERMFATRAMAFARGDRSHFPSFDENAYADNSGADRRSLADLTDELAAVRRATVLLLRSFDEQTWSRRGVASGYEFTVRSLAWIIAGHSRHHRRVLAERYLGDSIPVPGE